MVWRHQWHTLYRLRKKPLQNFVIPSDARNLSFFSWHEIEEIPRFARNDKINYFFRSLFSLWAFGTRDRKVKPTQAEASATRGAGGIRARARSAGLRVPSGSTEANVTVDPFLRAETAGRMIAWLQRLAVIAGFK
jgi:hypothetical protein